MRCGHPRDSKGIPSARRGVSYPAAVGRRAPDTTNPPARVIPFRAPAGFRRQDSCQGTRRQDPCQGTRRQDPCQGTRRQDSCQETRRARASRFVPRDPASSRVKIRAKQKLPAARGNCRFSNFCWVAKLRMSCVCAGSKKVAGICAHGKLPVPGVAHELRTRREQKSCRNMRSRQVAGSRSCA